MTRAVQIRQQTSMARWSEIIAEQRNSGFTIQDFCEQRNLSVHAYYYWLRLIREHIASDMGQQPTANVGKTLFVELPVNQTRKMTRNDTAAAPDRVTINISNITLSMPTTSSQTTIRNFISVTK